MADPNRLTDEEREDLVSYLDGEVDKETARSIEARLTQSASTRREAESLQRTWDLLDYLPRPRASESFTNRTLERLETGIFSQRRRRRVWRWVKGIAWAGSVLAAAAIGFLLVSHSPAPAPPEPSPEEIRLLEHREYWHYYEKIDGLEFLRELERSGLFGEDS